MMRRLLPVLTALVLGGCEALLVEPEPLPSLLEMSLAITEGSASQSYGDLTGGLQAVRHARFRFSSAGAVRDTVAPARVVGSAATVRVTLRPEETRGWLTVEAELLTDNHQPLFRGNGILRPDELAPTTSIPLTPVAASVTVFAVPQLNSVGDTVTLNGRAEFASLVPIPGAVIHWETLDPTIAEVVNGNRLVSRSNGSTTVVGSVQDAVGQATAVVRQAPVSLTGIGPADTTVAVGATFRARPFGQDARGFPLLPGANVQWSARGVVTVNSQGIVGAQSAGTGFVDATLAGVVHTSQVTVTP